VLVFGLALKGSKASRPTPALTPTHRRCRRIQNEYDYDLEAVMRTWFLAAIAALIVYTVPMSAQETRKSPHDTVKATVDGANVSIAYGRPYMKGRKIVGGLVPYGKVWRTGADEATTLTTDKALTVEGRSWSPDRTRCGRCPRRAAGS
jgi:hypothetical protein